VTPANLLEGFGQVDSIDMDIEGQEPPVIQSTNPARNEQVKRLHIGTHGKEIEDGVRHLLYSEKSAAGGSPCCEASIHPTLP
jgi:hypothetical protein